MSENSHKYDQAEAPQALCAPSSFICKRYKSSNDEHGIKDVVLESEQSQTHVGENEVLCQEIQQFKQLQHKKNNKLLQMTASLVDLYVKGIRRDNYIHQEIKYN